MDDGINSSENPDEWTTAPMVVVREGKRKCLKCKVDYYYHTYENGWEMRTSCLCDYSREIGND
uniref:Uncharacterized protein n=1 Tax=viral metagenome TaxID=1070528 RepID=A0A6H1ZXC1_9ZZZZ